MTLQTKLIVIIHIDKISAKKIRQIILNKTLSFYLSLLL